MGVVVEVVVSDDPAGEAARRIVAGLRAVVAREGRATLALSGGSTAPALIARLAQSDLDWARVEVWQVDERVAPDGHPDRNADQLDGFPAIVHLMPVTAADLTEAAAEYGGGLPARFDVVHLGLGDDGHTASWPPGDPGPVDAAAPVVVTAPFHGRRRMTLTPGPVNDAVQRVVLTLGSGKAPALAAWRRGDPRLPVAHLRTEGTVVVCDPAAAAASAG